MTVSAYAQGERRRLVPIESDPIKPRSTQTEQAQTQESEQAKKLKMIQSCRKHAKTQIQTWNAYIIGDDDAAKLNLMSFLDAVASRGQLLAGVTGYSRDQNRDIVVRRASFWYNHANFENLKKYYERANKPEQIERLNSFLALDAMLKELLEIDGLVITCPASPERMQMAPRSGVTGSN